MADGEKKGGVPEMPTETILDGQTLEPQVSYDFELKFFIQTF
jgi:hypothetical protein